MIDSAAISLGRIGAMVLRYTYLLRSSWPRILEMVYWPAVQMLTWGFLQTYLVRAQGVVPNSGAIAIGEDAHRLVYHPMDALELRRHRVIYLRSRPRFALECLLLKFASFCFATSSARRWNPVKYDPYRAERHQGKCRFAGSNLGRLWRVQC